VGSDLRKRRPPDASRPRKADHGICVRARRPTGTAERKFFFPFKIPEKLDVSR
jgi:hypothetical protein